MNIRVDVQMDEVVKLTATVLRQLPYAANSAITRTAKEAVDAGQKEVAGDLQIRKRFILNRMKILQYSRVNNLTAIIGIDTKVQGAPLILGFLEEGGTKEPIHGGELAIPLTGEKPRPTFASSVSRGFFYSNLHFQKGKGWHRTYIIPGVGIFQRIKTLGKRAKKSLGVTADARASDSVLIYAFKPSAPLPQHLHLRKAIVDVIGARFAAIFSEEFTKEILKKAQRGA